MKSGDLSFPQSLLTTLKFSEVRALSKLPEVQAIYSWALGYLPKRPANEQIVHIPGLALINGNGELTRSTRNFLTKIGTNKHRPSPNVILEYLRLGAREIVFHQVIRMRSPAWQKWDKEAQIKAAHEFLQRAEEFGLAGTMLEEIQNRYRMLVVVHSEVRDFGEGRPWIVIERQDARSFIGLSTVSSKTDPIKQAAWNRIILPLVKYLSPFFERDTRKDTRTNKVPQGAYKATAQILSTEFPGVFDFLSIQTISRSVLRCRTTSSPSSRLPITPAGASKRFFRLSGTKSI